MGEQQQKQQQESPLHFVVIVLGDVGRSPRMQYHAMSLLHLGEHVNVSLVGYTGEDLIDELQGEKQRLSVIRFHVPTPPAALAQIRPLYFVWRVLTVSLWLLWALFTRVQKTPAVTAVLVQNPPALPLLAIAALFCRLRQARFIIDWHNLGFSMLDSHLLRKLVKAYEFRVAPLADGHLTVTHAMKKYFVEQTTLIHPPQQQEEEGVIEVLHDCPPSLFRPLSVTEQHQIMSKLHSDLCKTIPRSWTTIHNLDPSVETILTTTRASTQQIQPRQGRPALVTSSTSWTPDEDFGLLLEALVHLDTAITQTHQSTLKVLVVVTGKGPQKELYLEKMSKLVLGSVAIQTVWLEPGDYPKLLACADVAVSLHTSTSGLDLPMKILDSFGCHVPVCARNFACLDELVQDQHNGRVFASAVELSNQLWELLSPLAAELSTAAAAPHSFGKLAQYSKNLEGRERWQDNWSKHALPVLLGQTK